MEEEDELLSLCWSLEYALWMKANVLSRSLAPRTAFCSRSCHVRQVVGVSNVRLRGKGEEKRGKRGEELRKEGGREGGKEGRKEGERERGKGEGGRKGRREGGREGEVIGGREKEGGRRKEEELGWEKGR